MCRRRSFRGLSGSRRGHRLSVNLNAFASSRNRQPLSPAEQRCSMFEVFLLDLCRWCLNHGHRRGDSELILRSRVKQERVGSRVIVDGTLIDNRNVMVNGCRIGRLHLRPEEVARCAGMRTECRPDRKKKERDDDGNAGDARILQGHVTSLAPPFWKDHGHSVRLTSRR